ncbi:hypothetical protein AB0M36_05190 [Actinoplanes sp. NPDC051346]|uniref:DUF2231 domain-containing protein n=1 Tax=Actinoplanes sp. NPDC051346 TaxID=3155048 RepID=UPI003419F7D9
MRTRLTVRGNAVQPLLLMFPFGLLVVAVILDVFHALGAPRLLGTLAYCTIVAGLLGGALAAAAVWIDTMAHRAETPQLLLDLAVLVIFTVIVLLRMRTPDRTALLGVLLVELLGLGIAGASAWCDAGGRPARRRPG